MHRSRLLILLAACFLMTSVAWADDLGYVECTSHPDTTPVFSKARQTPDSVGAIPCGERFTVLVYGFVFSRIQTKDGKIGYLYSNLITSDRGGAAASQAAAARVPVTNTPAKAPTNSAAQMDSPPVTTSPARDKPAAAQAGPLFPTPPMPAVTASDMASARAQSAPTATAPVQTAYSPAPTPAASAQPAAPAASRPAVPTSVETQSASKPASASVTQPTPAPSLVAPPPSQPSVPAPVETQPAAQPPAAQTSAPAQPGPLFPTPPPSSGTTDAASAPAAEPTPAPASASQPEAAQPAPAPVRDASVRSSWERPVPGARQNFLVELYSGYSFARFTSAGSSTNLNGGMGSFGYNLKPWLQIVGDSSYNFVTIGGTKNILYGNHFGGRVFYHRGAPWGFTPFAEVLVGGSRLDTSGGGVQTSTNCISYKAGGGVDIRVTRRWEIRVINVDYYRTTFGAGGYNATQNNYWASAGVILRLFGSGASE